MGEQFLTTMEDLNLDGNLALGRLRSSTTLPDFDALVARVLTLRGSPQTPKMAHCGYIPSLFSRTLHPKWAKWGLWRNGLAEIDWVSCLVMDIDNDQTGRAAVTWSEVIGLGCRAFGYDSYSATPTNPRFRVLLETDRHMTRVEVRKVMAYLSREVFNQQADMSMSHAAHYAIAPASHAKDYHLDGYRLPVDALVARCHTELAGGCPYLLRAATKGVHAPTGGTRTAATHLLTDHSGDPAMIAWVAESDIAEYQLDAQGHWIGMFIALQRAFRRAGGVLTFGDMQQIAWHIDQFENDYFGTKYGSDGFAARITDAMSVELRKIWLAPQIKPKH